MGERVRPTQMERVTQVTRVRPPHVANGGHILEAF